MPQVIIKIAQTKAFFLSLFAILWGLLAPNSAHAYVDPGTGALLWQLLLAGILGIGFFIHKSWRWIGTMFSRLKRRISSGRNLKDHENKDNLSASK